LTTIPPEGDLPMWQKPAFWAVVVGLAFVVLQIIFW